MQRLLPNLAAQSLYIRRTRGLHAVGLRGFQLQDLQGMATLCFNRRRLFVGSEGVFVSCIHSSRYINNP